MSQSSSISIDASIDTAAAVSSSMIPFTASQIPLAVIKKLGMHSTNAVSNPGHAFPSLVADDLGPSDAIDSDDDFTLLLPAANQTALAAPVDPKVANQLCSFRLRLLQHPALLLCTRPECTHHLPLIPTYVNVFQHLKSHHHPLTKTGVKLLEETLLALDLVSPATVSIKTNLLPINLIKELDTFDGYCCSICKYAVKSSSSAYKHQRSNHDGKASVMHPILIQPIFTSGPFTRYVWVLNSKLEPTPPPVTFNINTNTEEDAAFKEQLAAFFAKDAELMAKADLDMEGIQPRTVTGNLSPWLKQLGWQEYWAGKPVAAIGSLGCNPHKWPGAHQDFLHWLLGMTQRCTQQWMEALLQSGRQVQQTFRAFEDTPSHPYSLDQPTVIKRAACWAMLITMLVHVMLDGKVLGYYGDDDQDAHLGISERLAGLIEDLQDLFHDPKLDVDVSMHPDVVVQAFSGIQSISIHLITQDPPAYGELERLPLLCSFLHLCLSPDGTSKPVNAATSMLVNLEFAFRAVMHHHLLHPEHGTLIGKTVPEINKGVQAVMKRYLFNNSYSASAHLQSLLCYGTKLAKDDGGSLYFRWSEDRKLVTYGTNTIKISRLDTLVQGTLDRATSLLEQLLLKDGALSKQVDLSMYKDHFRNREPGYSFVAATQQDAGTFCLCQALKGFPQHQPLLDTCSAEPEFDTAAAHGYFALHNEFNKLLAVLIELTSGLPARGTELVKLQHTNTLVSQRNLFLADGHFVTVLASNKGKGPPKLIPRFLPHAVGQLVLFYVMEVVPFLHLLFNSVEVAREPSALLLVNHRGQPWQTNEISKTLQSLCQEFVGPSASSLHIRNWRQLSVSIDKVLIRPGLPSEEYADHSHDLQAGHSTSTAQQHYGLDSSMLLELTQESLDCMLSVSKRWHAFWCLASRYQDAVQPLDAAALPQAGSGCVNAALPADLKRKLDKLEEDVQHIRRKVEEKPSALLANIIAPVVENHRSAVLPPVVRKALFKVTGSHCTKTVEQAYALDAICRRESPLIIVMATGTGKSALFMTPLFWLPPTSVVVVVVPFIVLMEDLLEQCKLVGIVASKWSGYNCAKKVDRSQLVLVAAENCYNQHFGSWAQELVEQERLAAIFFDECHVCITQDSFRPSMAKIKQLITTVPVPQYLLTATLPPSLLSTFKGALCLPQDGTGIIRAATNRNNIGYSVQWVLSSATMDFCIQQLLQSHPHGSIMVICRSRVAAETTARLLSCQCIWSEMDQAEKKAILLLWLASSAAEMDNSKRVLVGTTAIGTGINPQHVSLVVHMDGAYDMVSYVQESGRAGRSGQAAKAVMMVYGGVRLEDKVELYVKEKVCRRVAISSYMDGMPLTCLSQPDLALCDLCSECVAGDAKTLPKPTTTINTPPRSDKPEEIGSAASSCLCPANAATSLPPSPSLQKRQHQQGMAKLGNNLSSLAQHPSNAANSPVDIPSTIDLLHKLSKQCSLCYLFGHRHSCIGKHGADHAFILCKCWSLIEACMPQWHEGQINGSHLGQVKNRMRRDKPKGVACYTCYAPIHICTNSSLAPMRGCTKRYADIVLPVVAVVLWHKEFRERICQELKVDCSDMSRLELDLCSAFTYKGEKVSLAYAIFAVAMENASML
ncbi:uncharacterized protein UDID_18000 [Ustilago sp. UG-2017a]|nr:uncharacterized protein UDID_18000 [Ustilago sp. UG-2017a]